MQRLSLLSVPLLAAALLVGFAAAPADLGAEYKNRIPNFRLPDLDGRERALSALQGENLTLIDFWATWCGPCVKSIPSLVSISEDYADRGVRVVGVNVDSPRNSSKVAPYARSLGVSYPILMDVNSEVMARLNVQAMPTLLVIDHDRELVYMHEGFRAGDEKHIRENLDDLLSDRS